VDETERERRWALVVPHRERLLSLARRLVRDPGDAEACVHEAMVRCVTFPRLDEANVAGFLVTTTRRICVDHHRLHARDGRVAARLSGMTAPEPHLDEAVCDRAEAAWVSARLADLPERQRAAVHARRDGRTHAEIAEYLAVSYKTVETLLYRARTRARAELERTYALLPAFLRRPRTGWGMAAGVGSVALVTSAAMLLAPGHGGPAPSAPSAAPFAGLGPVAGAAPAREPAVGPAGSVAPRAPFSDGPGPSEPAGSGSPTPFGAGTTPCPAPPYWAQPCVSPRPDRTPLVGYLDCVLYGIDTASGFSCNQSPTPSPSAPRNGRPEGAPR
jgi:RNA polymerase sigma factor (sigma-70 family)